MPEEYIFSFDITS